MPSHPGGIQMHFRRYGKGEMAVSLLALSQAMLFAPASVVQLVMLVSQVPVPPVMALSPLMMSPSHVSGGSRGDGKGGCAEGGEEVAECGFGFHGGWSYRLKIIGYRLRWGRSFRFSVFQRREGDKHRTSNVERRTSNVEHRMLKGRCLGGGGGQGES